MTHLEGDGQAVEGSDSFAFISEIFVKPSCAFERLVKEDFREGICLDGTEESQLGPSGESAYHTLLCSAKTEVRMGEGDRTN